MSESLFPPDVCVASGADEEDRPLHPAEQDLAGRMGPARRREFAAGRACAHRALAQLGAPDAAVLRGARRAPTWPPGVVGSITHTDGYCAAAVARRERWAGLGIDAERRKALSERVLARICSPEERDALRALPGGPAEFWGTVVFSAKESLYKAYFPLTEVYLGFRDAEVRLDPARGRFEAHLVRSDAPDAAGRRSFAGRFVLHEAHVLSGLAIPAA